jgi:hypothetical protein
VDKKMDEIFRGFLRFTGFFYGERLACELFQRNLVVLDFL